MDGIDEAHEEVKKLGGAISKQDFRDDFVADQDAALLKHGVDKGKVPQDVLDALSGLTSQQLAVLSTVKDALTAKKVPPHIKAEMV